MDRVKRIWFLSLMRAAKVKASLCIRAVSPEPSLLAHTSSKSRGTFRQKARSLAPLSGWTCAVKICHDGMLEDTNSFDGARMISWLLQIILIYNTNVMLTSILPRVATPYVTTATIIPNSVGIMPYKLYLKSTYECVTKHKSSEYLAH